MFIVANIINMQNFVIVIIISTIIVGNIIIIVVTIIIVFNIAIIINLNIVIVIVINIIIIISVINTIAIIVLFPKGRNCCVLFWFCFCLFYSCFFKSLLFVLIYIDVSLDWDDISSHESEFDSSIR